jgi:alkanesulfonate monooxygenase
MHESAQASGAMTTVYSTCPSSHCSPEQFRRRITDVARWTESSGCRGLLVYTDNTLVDPWAAAQFMLERTERLVPLVAVQPAYMHPFSVARMVSTIAFAYEREVDLNLVTGGFAGHLVALGCLLQHDERYDRLVEYAKIVKRLLAGTRPVTHMGQYYGLNGASISPPLPAELAPRILISGASEACVKAQGTLGVVRLAYPRAIDDYAEDTTSLQGTGIRLGIIARDTNEEAWRLAHQRFPADELGEQLHDLAAGQVESQWHKNLSRDAQAGHAPRDSYWLYPFRAYKTFCPYLVGTYEEVADMLARYLRFGISTIILDVPAEEDDLHHASIAIRRAQSIAYDDDRATVAGGSGPR